MKIKTKLKLSSTIILSLGAIGFSMLGFYFLKSMFNQRYIQLVDLSFFLFSASVALSFLYFLLKNEAITVGWENRHLRLLGIGFIVLWIVFLLIFIKQDNHGNIIVDSENTTQVSGMLQNKPLVKLGSKNSKSIEIYLVEYPNFKFKLTKPEFEALNADQFLSSVNKGDSITITLWKDTYNKKIIESEELTFTDKHLNYHKINILGLVKNGIEFMPKEKVNQVRKKFYTKGNFYGLMAFVVFGVGSGIYLITLSNKARR